MPKESWLTRVYQVAHLFFFYVRALNMIRVTCLKTLTTKQNLPAGRQDEKEQVNRCTLTNVPNIK